ncbi:MAG TPA: uL15 family ribosomal protein [Patescibacteria group bacterium]|nr:uL15 family ribosomal protein [Patescibacteria group bacterium]
MIKLPKLVKRGKKAQGRGMGSGKGSHTSGRGQKGQKSRSHIGVLFEGVKTKKSLLKRLPLMRGKGKFSGNAKPEIITVTDLENLPTGSEITVELLVKEGIVDAKLAKKNGVKVLGGGKTTKKFTFLIPTSASVASRPEASAKGDKSVSSK